MNGNLYYLQIAAVYELGQVSDLTDPCPNKAGKNGAPCPDSDGDGLNDNIDDCPNIAGPESNGGCKLVDIDNDGVPNINDKCPNEAGEEELGGAGGAGRGAVEVLRSRCW